MIHDFHTLMMSVRFETSMDHTEKRTTTKGLLVVREISLGLLGNN